MYMPRNLDFEVSLVGWEEMPTARAEILRVAGDHAAAAPIGSARGTKGAGQRR